MIFIKYQGKQILLECGLYQSNDYLDSYKVNSKKFKFHPNEIDYVFINHAHVDHIGLLPRLVKEGFNGSIITSTETALLMKPLLLNCAYILASEARIISKKYKRTYNPIYAEEDVYNTLSLIKSFNDVNTIYGLDENINFQWLSNSHCIGARQLQLCLKDENKSNINILYTSDLGSIKSVNHYVNNSEIPEMFNKITIMESTYGERSRLCRKTRSQDLNSLRTAVLTTIDRNGTVILPAFSFSRTQELLTNLYLLFGKDPDFKIPIVVDSQLTCQISDIYSKMLTKADYDLWEKVSTWKNVRFVDEKLESDAVVQDEQPKIILSSSGFCTNGRILKYLKKYLKDVNSLIIFSGYVGKDNSYLSYRIKNGKEHKYLNIDKTSVANKADCISLLSFSSHANRDDLITYGSSLCTEKLVLVHGSQKAKEELQEDITEAVSKNDKCYNVLISTKDMVVRL